MRAQGSLEYLIILAIVIAVMAVVASFAIGYFSTQSDQFQYASCSNAAAICRDTLIVSQSDQCPMCDNACNYTNGTEIFTNATVCCKQGQASEIYTGSPGCGPQSCSDGTLASTCSSVTLGKYCVGPYFRDLCSTCDCLSSLRCNVGNNKCGTLSFEPGKSIWHANPSGSWAVAIGDADNDGSNDVVAGFYSLSGLSVKLFSFKTGIWTETVLPAGSSYGVHSIAIGDINADGSKEVVVGFELGGTAATLSAFNFTAGAWAKSDAGVGSPVGAVAIGDINKNGKNVIAASIGVNAYVMIFEPRPLVLWSYTTVDNVGEIVPSVVIADADNDGNIEIVAGTTGSSNQLIAYSNKSGAWIKSVIGSPGQVTSIAVGDVDGDNKNETVVGTQSNGLNIYKYVDGSWLQTIIPEPTKINSVAIGDANNDGSNDVVIGLKPTNNELRMYTNTSGRWVETLMHDEPLYEIASVAVGNADNQQGIDVVTTLGSFSSGYVDMYTGSWTYA